MTTDYEKQAADFLEKFGIKFRATLSDSKPALWEPAGHHYRVTLNHTKPCHVGNGRSKNYGKHLVFDFWGSKADMDNKRTELSAYDVLACVSSDVHTPETFKEFCDEFGYDTDSIKAKQTFERANRFAKRLRDFFTQEEIEQLQEIQ